MWSFLKLTPIKITLALVLFTLSGYLWHLYIISTVSDSFPWGFPLQFYLSWGPCPAGSSCKQSNVLFLIIDVLFWYIVSAYFASRFAKSSR